VLGNIILKPLTKESPERKDESGGIRLVQVNKIDIDDSLPVPVYDFLLEQAGKEGCELYGIVDSAKNEDVFRHLIIGGVRYKSLFEGTMDEQSYGVSGFLVECKKESPLFKWMTTEAWGDSCCIFFTSKASFDDLFKHFQKFNRVYLEGDEVVLFRYYDPRVLRTYLPTCNRGEVEMFFGEVMAFIAENKNPELLTRFEKNASEGSGSLQVSNYKILLAK
jgi:hypothetical protein